MPTYDYKCRECGEVFEVFRHFSELDKEVKCPNCGSLKTERIFSVLGIQGETVTGAKFGPDVPQSSPGRGMGRGMGRGLGRGPRDGRGMGRGWRRS
jgi:putative FmdB family regulatory protein